MLTRARACTCVCSPLGGFSFFSLAYRNFRPGGGGEEGGREGEGKGGFFAAGPIKNHRRRRRRVLSKTPLLPAEKIRARAAKITRREREREREKGRRAASAKASRCQARFGSAESITSPRKLNPARVPPPRVVLVQRMAECRNFGSRANKITPVE